MAYAATGRAVRRDMEEGSVGAGTGATVGKIHGPAMSMKGGFGCAVESLPNGELSVAAMAVVNAFGDVRDSRGEIIAGARSVDGGFVDTLAELKRAQSAPASKFDDLPLQNTTICVVAVSVPRTSAELTQIARASGAGLFRRITPAGTSIDGDTIFAVAPDAPTGAISAKQFEPTLVESLAAVALEKAIERAVRLARGSGDVPGLADGK
jgi:L-aminopeptidase/D-esterase-like protein